MTPEYEEALALASRLWTRDLVVEAAGLFWIAAELGILYLVLLARFHVEHRPSEPVPCLSPAFRRRLWRWIAGFLLLCVLIGARFYFYPLRDALEAALQTSAHPDAIAALYARWAYTHALVWCAFITIWVILEAAIVYHGRHVYLGLRRALSPVRHGSIARPSLTNGAPLSLLLLGAALVLAAPASAAMRIHGFAPEQAAETFAHTHEAFGALRNAVGLYLRIAGVVWITVEWIAAFYLWRGYRLIRRVSRVDSVAS